MTLTTQPSCQQSGSTHQHARSVVSVAVERCPLCETKCRNGYYCASCVNNGTFGFSNTLLEGEHATTSKRIDMKELRTGTKILADRASILAQIEASSESLRTLVARRAQLEFLRHECELRIAQIAALKTKIAKGRSRVVDYTSMLFTGEKKREVRLSKMKEAERHRDSLRKRRDLQRARLNELLAQLEVQRRSRASQLLTYIFTPFSVMPPSCDDLQSEADNETVQWCFMSQRSLPLAVNLLDTAASYSTLLAPPDGYRHLACAWFISDLCAALARLFDSPGCDVPLEALLTANQHYASALKARAEVSADGRMMRMSNKPLRVAFRAVNHVAQRLAFFSLEHARVHAAAGTITSDDKNAKALVELARFVESRSAVLRNLYVAAQLLVGVTPSSVLQTMLATDPHASATGGVTGTGMEWDLDTLDDDLSDAESEDEQRQRHVDAPYPMHRSVFEHATPRMPVATMPRNRSVSVARLDYPVVQCASNASQAEAALAQAERPSLSSTPAVGLARPLQADVDAERDVDAESEVDLEQGNRPASDWCVVDDEPRADSDGDEPHDHEPARFTTRRRMRALTECESDKKSPPIIQQSMLTSIFNALIRK